MDRVTAAQVFVEIAERGSMVAAADALDMSRAMVTRYLAQMEQWAGARLLHRTTRRLSLTAAGEQVLARCRGMLAFAAEMPFVPLVYKNGVATYSKSFAGLSPTVSDIFYQFENLTADFGTKKE